MRFCDPAPYAWLDLSFSQAAHVRIYFFVIYWQMETVDVTFFGKQENLTAIQGFASVLQRTNLDPSNAPNVASPLRTFFAVLLHNTQVFDRYCASNIEWIGGHYIRRIDEYSALPEDKKQDALLHIFTLSYRFLCELEFSQPGDLSFELQSIKRFVEENLDKFSGLDRHQLVYANYIMPANVTKRLINSPAIVEFQKFSEVARVASNLKEQWDKELSEKKEEIDALRQGVSRIATQYNFVGLVKGFEFLAAAKKKERLRSFVGLIILGLIMVLPVSVQLGFAIHNIGVIEQHKDVLIYTLPPLITLEVILFYFFRVALSNFKATSAQLLQIDLRVSLCQFIQSYAEYSAKIKSQDSKALEKFENMIFSGIVSEQEALPSTFDGIEQIAKLFANIKGKQ